MTKEYTEVIISPGYGSGWSTWNDPEDAYNPTIIQMIKDGRLDEAMQYAESLGKYASGLEDAIILNVPKGTHHRITEYDGHESIEYRDEIDWEIA